MGLSSTFLVAVLESENSVFYTTKVIKDDQSSLMLTLDCYKVTESLAHLSIPLK